MTNVELLVDAHALVGEGPIWDDDQQVLYWVDILSNKLYAYDPATGQNKAYDVGQHVGARPVLQRLGGEETAHVAVRQAVERVVPLRPAEYVLLADQPDERVEQGLARFEQALRLDRHRGGARERLGEGEVRRRRSPRPGLEQREHAHRLACPVEQRDRGHHDGTAGPQRMREFQRPAGAGRERGDDCAAGAEGFRDRGGGVGPLRGCLRLKRPAIGADDRGPG